MSSVPDPPALPFDWNNVLCLSALRRAPEDNKLYAISMAFPASVYIYLKYTKHPYAKFIEDFLPTREDCLAAIKRERPVPSKIKLISDSVLQKRGMLNFPDLLLSYVLPIIGPHVALVPESVTQMMTSPSPSFEGHALGYFNYIEDADIICMSIFLNPRDPAAPGYDVDNIDHCGPVIVLWREKQILFTDPYGDPKVGKDTYLKDHILEGLRTLVAWICLIKNQKDDPSSYTGFKVTSVGLPDTFKQIVSLYCPAYSCAILLLFVKYFSAQHQRGEVLGLPPVPSGTGGLYDFKKVCMGELTQLPQSGILTFPPGLLRLIAESMEAKDFSEHKKFFPDAEDSAQTFLMYSVSQQKKTMSKSLHDAFKIPTLPDGYELPMISDGRVIRDILEARDRIKTIPKNEIQNELKTMSSGKLLLLALAMELPETPNLKDEIKSAEIIFNCVYNDMATKLSSFAPPEPPFLTMNLADITDDCFNRGGPITATPSPAPSGDVVEVSSSDDDEEGD